MQAWSRLPTETSMERRMAAGQQPGYGFRNHLGGAVTTLYSFSSSDGTYRGQGWCKVRTELLRTTYLGGANNYGRFSKSPRRHADHAAQLQFHGWRLPNATLVQAQTETSTGQPTTANQQLWDGFQNHAHGTLTTLHSFDYTDVILRTRAW